MTVLRSLETGPAGELERIAVQLAEGAAAVVRGHRPATLAVSAKSTPTDLVTGADRASEQWLVERIADLRPHDSVVGEEGARRHGTSGVGWVLDPLDGTVNYVLGLPRYAVSVAVEMGGQVIAGAVCDAASGEMFHARIGCGAYLGDTRLVGPRKVPLAQAVVGTGFGYDPVHRARQGAVVARLLPRVADIRRLGAASLDMCGVAAGRLDAYFEAGLNRWDYAAGVLIATEAGCTASGLRRRTPSSRFVAVAGAELAGQWFALLEDLDADEVSS